MFFQKSSAAVNAVIDLPVCAIRPNPDQPRLCFDEAALAELAASIKRSGVIQPLTVKKDELSPTYTLITGERRLRAAKLANLDYVPCIAISGDNKDCAIMAIVENIQRTDLNFIEEARAIQRLILHYGLTQEEAAARLGIAQPTVANKLRLLNLSEEQMMLLLKLGLNERQARAILRLPNEKRERAIRDIYTRQLNSSETDRYVEKLLSESKPKPTVIRRMRTMDMVGLYINNFNRTVKEMNEAGIPCEAIKRSGDGYVEYVVKIPIK